MSSPLPLSSDIYLEANGKKVAVVQNYTASTTKKERSIEAFGEKEPVAAIAGQPKYNVELTRLYATPSAISDGINFYDLTDFSLVIAKPDRRIIFLGCNWTSINEAGTVGDVVAEKISLIATHRVEIAR